MHHNIYKYKKIKHKESRHEKQNNVQDEPDTRCTLTHLRSI